MSRSRNQRDGDFPHHFLPHPRCSRQFERENCIMRCFSEMSAFRQSSSMIEEVLLLSPIRLSRLVGGDADRVDDDPLNNDTGFQDSRLKRSSLVPFLEEFLFPTLLRYRRLDELLILQGSKNAPP